MNQILTQLNERARELKQQHQQVDLGLIRLILGEGARIATERIVGRVRQVREQMEKERQ